MFAFLADILSYVDTIIRCTMVLSPLIVLIGVATVLFRYFHKRNIAKQKEYKNYLSSLSKEDREKILFENQISTNNALVIIGIVAIFLLLGNLK